MRFRKFLIKDYRAVDSAEVPVSQALSPLIGINESGKTSILHAILAFAKVSDRFNAGQHLAYENKYGTTDHEDSLTRRTE